MKARGAAAIDLLLPVLDGDNPALWPIWEKPLEEHVARFYETGSHIPSDIEALGTVRLDFLLHSEQKLHQRSADAWKNVIGVLVDCNGDAEQRGKAADRVIGICTELPKDAWCRKLRFYIGLLVSSVAASQVTTYKDFAHNLKLRAQGVLFTEVECQPVADAYSFQLLLKTFEKQIAYMYARPDVRAA